MSEKKQHNIDDLYLDLKAFKLDIRQTLQDQFDKQLSALQSQILNLRNIGISLATIFCIVFVYVFDNRLDDNKEYNQTQLNSIKEYNQARLEKLEDILFSLASEDFIYKMRERKRNIEKEKQNIKKKDIEVKRDLNNVVIY